jgi:hypothetical protein
MSLTMNQQHHLSKLYFSGYEADVDAYATSEEEESDNSSLQLGLSPRSAISRNLGKRRRLQQHSDRKERKRLHHYHPDIDISLTQLWSPKQYDEWKSEGSSLHEVSSDRDSPMSNSTSLSVYHLNKMLLEAFQEAKQLYKKEKKGTPAPTVPPNSISEDGGEYEGDDDSSESLPPPEGNLQLSSRTLTLQDTLEISTRPRLLVEASKPYELVHKNAACVALLGSRLRSQRGDSTIQDALYCYVGSHSGTIYPVQSERGDRISHYLVQLRGVPTSSNFPHTTVG